MSASPPVALSVANLSELQRERLAYEPPLPSVLNGKIALTADLATTATVDPDILGMFPGLGGTSNVLAQVGALVLAAVARACRRSGCWVPRAGYGLVHGRIESLRPSM